MTSPSLQRGFHDGDGGQNVQNRTIYTCCAITLVNIGQSEKALADALLFVVWTILLPVIMSALTRCTPGPGGGCLSTR